MARCRFFFFLIVHSSQSFLKGFLIKIFFLFMGEGDGGVDSTFRLWMSRVSLTQPNYKQEFGNTQEMKLFEARKVENSVSKITLRRRFWKAKNFVSWKSNWVWNLNKKYRKRFIEKITWNQNFILGDVNLWGKNSWSFCLKMRNDEYLVWTFLHFNLHSMCWLNYFRGPKQTKTLSVNYFVLTVYFWTILFKLKIYFRDVSSRGENIEQ